MLRVSIVEVHGVARVLVERFAGGRKDDQRYFTAMSLDEAEDIYADLHGVVAELNATDKQATVDDAFQMAGLPKEF